MRQREREREHGKKIYSRMEIIGNQLIQTEAMNL